MKRGAATFVGRRRLAWAAAIVVWGLFAAADCQAQEVLLLLEQTPVKGGDITPIAGVHHFKPGSEVVLSASPKPGYQFVHWLGDVSDATARSTVVYLNKPKVIVAVFGQTEHGSKDILPAAGGGGGRSGLMPTAGKFFPQGGISPAGGGGGKPQPGPVTYVLDTKKTTPEVPEPATGVLLVVGSLLAFARRRKTSS